MSSDSTPLRDDAIAIWQAGVKAVDSASLVRQAIDRQSDRLTIAGEVFPLDSFDRLIVVGGGKAGAGMAAGLEQALGADLVRERLHGWINVPADCVQPLQAIHLHPGRLAGQNEPTAQGVAGTEQILRLAGSLTQRDLCLVLLSGGGSALLPAPMAGISLEDKQLITRRLMQSGATIEELNAVRSCLSRIKAGGLLRAMPAGRAMTLVISDVIHDPLPVIASGPTVDRRPNPQQALEILTRRLSPADIPSAVLTVLQQAKNDETPAKNQPVKGATCRHAIIGNNQSAVSAAAHAARARGYRVVLEETNVGGVARDVGRDLAEKCLALSQSLEGDDRCCLISGGEPVVEMVPTSQPRQGGRNQELVLAAADRLKMESIPNLVILSGGTDGEDGPTDAAGAIFDVAVQTSARQRALDPATFLAINNSYPFFAATGGLLKTGPTHTNVMDLRVALAARDVTHP